VSAAYALIRLGAALLALAWVWLTVLAGREARAARRAAEPGPVDFGGGAKWR